ncbi:hypothetical protein GOBAR_DD03605 [Gossypium barbadense]|nr:hypothetical protein GOBAR_DD03605 [Gossypium barbadense]
MNAAVSFIGGTNGNKKGLSATLAANPGDLKLRASLSDNYDLEKKSWDLAVSRRILGGDLIKANYETLSQVLGVEWSCSSLVNEDGRVKVTFQKLTTLLISLRSKEKWFQHLSIWLRASTRQN